MSQRNAIFSVQIEASSWYSMNGPVYLVSEGVLWAYGGTNGPVSIGCNGSLRVKWFIKGFVSS